MKLPGLIKTTMMVKQAGFTMIELLVVISVIGVLAVAVLSSINPIEQINKGRDTRTRSDAAQLINAVERYFATHEYYPWNNTSDPGYTPPAGISGADNFDEEFEFDAVAGAGTVADWTWADTLIDTAEIKQGFLSRLDDEDRHYIYKGSDSNATLYICFLPSSEAFKLEAAEKCRDGESPEDDPDFNGSVTICDTTDGTISDDNWICLP